jgi:hypothetical protein
LIDLLSIALKPLPTHSPQSFQSSFLPSSSISDISSNEDIISVKRRKLSNDITETSKQLKSLPDGSEFDDARHVIRMVLDEQVNELKKTFSL